MEYSELAANLYKGCDHGCTYCYAPSATFTSREKFMLPKPRPSIINKLMQDAVKLSEDESIREGQVMLCFTCDPYQPIDEEYQLTRQAIKVLHENSMNVSILTKGGNRSERDFDLLGKRDSYGATLTFIDKRLSLEYEPQASLPEERFAALAKAHSLGISTWVSLELIINPVQTMEIIRQTSAYVDMYKMGIWNYDKRAAELDYAKFVTKAINLISSLGSKYYIKKDLARYM
ncbi:radical SAM protein [Chloroflexota bacterium]